MFCHGLLLVTFLYPSFTPSLQFNVHVEVDARSTKTNTRVPFPYKPAWNQQRVRHSLVKSVSNSRNFYHIPTAFGYVPIVTLLASLETSKPFWFCCLVGYKSSATPLTNPTTLEIFTQTPLQRLNLSSHSHQYNVGLLLRAILRLWPPPRRHLHPSDSASSLRRWSARPQARSAKRCYPRRGSSGIEAKVRNKSHVALYKDLALTHTYL